MYKAKMILDSISNNGIRLSTMEVTMPRIILAEFNTHRMFSRNSASSRAIPTRKMIERVENDPFIPVMRYAQKGMQPSSEEVSDYHRINMLEFWEYSLNTSINTAKALCNYDCAKEIVNRLLEPFMWHTVIVTATDWDNFFALRLHENAQLEIRETAKVMLECMQSSSPVKRDLHLPFVLGYSDEILDLDFDRTTLSKISSARCARVSYLTHDGVCDYEKDLELADRLLKSGHMSPFEHVARQSWDNSYSGNFRGWIQFRKTINGESIFKGNE